MPVWTRTSLSAALLGGLVVVSGHNTAMAAETCAGGTGDEAARLGRDIRAAAARASGTISVAVYDRTSDTTCLLNAHRHYDSASTVKATILAALLLRRGRPGHLSAAERASAREMITRSDNDAASYLWGRVGRQGIQRLLDRAGMSETELSPTGSWGLTQITAADELKLLRALTEDGVLPAASRSYELSLMHAVITSQRWGTPDGTPEGVTWHVKNGWLPRATHQWRVHSLGAFSGRGHDYLMAILTQDEPTMLSGVASIQRVARVVHRDIAAAVPAGERSAAPGETAPGGTGTGGIAPGGIDQTPDDVLP